MRPGDLRNLKRVGQPACDNDPPPAKGSTCVLCFSRRNDFACTNPVAIALKIRAQIVRIDRLFTPARLRALHREGREPLRFPLLQLLAYRHQNRPFA